MIKPALCYKEEIEKKFAEVLYSEEYFYYAGYAHCHWIPEIKPEDNNYQWAVLDNNDVIGYIAYKVHPELSSVDCFGLISFDIGNPIVGRELYRIVEDLVKTHHRIEWRMVGGNPIERSYDAICHKFNGKKFVLTDVEKDAKGNYRDSIIYEIITNN